MTVNRLLIAEYEYRYVLHTRRQPLRAFYSTTGTKNKSILRHTGIPPCPEIQREFGFNINVQGVILIRVQAGPSGICCESTCRDLWYIPGSGYELTMMSKLCWPCRPYRHTNSPTRQPGVLRYILLCSVATHRWCLLERSCSRANAASSVDPSPKS